MRTVLLSPNFGLLHPTAQCVWCSKCQFCWKHAKNNKVLSIFQATHVTLNVSGWNKYLEKFHCALVYIGFWTMQCCKLQSQLKNFLEIFCLQSFLGWENLSLCLIGTLFRVQKSVNLPISRTKKSFDDKNCNAQLSFIVHSLQFSAQRPWSQTCNDQTLKYELCNIQVCTSYFHDTINQYQ